MAGNSGQSNDSKEKEMAEVQPTQDEILIQIHQQLKALSDWSGPRRSLPGLECNVVLCEQRLTRIETKLDDLIGAVKEDRAAVSKKFETHDSELKSVRKGYLIGVGGLGVLSFLSPALLKIFFHF